ncbi:MAG: P-type conjugative transfer ATPase TrbB [Gammaproteobacteria bacterium]|nr:P-type conjugative transfer ATPase TrbB [Gammaproteobacteria bacterium]
MMMPLSESHLRLYAKLYRDLGDDIIQFLHDKEINEVMLNPDGKLWIDSAAKGLQFSHYVDRAQAFSIIHSVAGIHNFVVTQHVPRLEAELPFFKAMQGERFTAQVPPIVSAPSFTIRKKSDVIFKLDAYLASNRMTLEQADILKKLIRERKNILVSGGPGSGKTTVTNALIMEAVKCDENQRFLILEDLPELRCDAPNTVAMLTSNEVSMRGLLRAAMRMRPDRILMGEVRGAEALDMLKAWNTGCPGGICTVHANGAREALQRILDLSLEAGLNVPPVQLALQTIDAIVSVIRQQNKKGFIQEIVRLKDYKNEQFIFEQLA